MTEIPSWFVLTSTIALLAILGFDLYLAFRRPHVPSTKESVFWVSLYVGLALVFAASLWLIGDSQHAGEFTAGWLTEYSLSVDNLFLFLLIMTRFAVPKEQVQRMLMVGIIIALVMRAIFIVAGVHLITSFSWIFYVFALIILYAAIHQLLAKEQTAEVQPGRIETWLRKHLAISQKYDGPKIMTTIKGRRVFTPVLLVYVTLSTADLVFALDSIPAIFGITQSAFLIITANIFALMGLRQLYFLLGTMVDRLKFLPYGISLILGFIAIKLITSALHKNQLAFINHGQPVTSLPEIPISVSLTVIVSILVASILASLVYNRRLAKH